MRDLYSWSHENFDVDFDNCCLLTNTHIKNNSLDEIDKNFLIQAVQKKIVLYEDKEKKRKREKEEYKIRKRRKLEALQMK